MKKCIITTLAVIIIGCCSSTISGCKHQDGGPVCDAPNTQNYTNSVPDWTWVPWWAK